MDRHGKWIMAANKAANNPNNTTVTVTPGAATTLTSGGYVITNPNGPTYTYTGITAGGGGGGYGGGGGAIGVGSWSSQTGQAKITAGTLDLSGDNADIKINDVSLTDTLKTIQERLNILVPNSLLENEWADLKKLGEQYRKLEAELEEKSRMWTALKKTE
jgi:uncharacterized protein with beta-barrel porin domain